MQYFHFCGATVGMALYQRTGAPYSRDQALEIKRLLTKCYQKKKKIILVMDNLNTHTPGSLYETFIPPKAKRLMDRFEFVYTPKHGSWLNMAEIELNVLIRQCLSRRIGSMEVMSKEVEYWQKQRNTFGAKIDWQFTTEDARIKLKRLYPTVVC